MFNVHKYKQYKNNLTSILKLEVKKILSTPNYRQQKQFKESLGNH